MPLRRSLAAAIKGKGGRVGVEGEEKNGRRIWTTTRSLARGKQRPRKRAAGVVGNGEGGASGHLLYAAGFFLGVGDGDGVGVTPFFPPGFPVPVFAGVGVGFAEGFGVGAGAGVADLPPGFAGLGVAVGFGSAAGFEAAEGFGVGVGAGVAAGFGASGGVGLGVGVAFLGLSGFGAS